MRGAFCRMYTMCVTTVRQQQAKPTVETLLNEHDEICWIHVCDEENKCKGTEPTKRMAYYRYMCVFVNVVTTRIRSTIRPKEVR